MIDINYIKELLQRIINKEFSENERRRIVTYHDRFNFCAPCCGDSHSNKSAKRGNLYYNTLLYVCFNCDRKTSFDRICKEFDEVIEADKKLEIIEHLSQNISYSDYESDYMDTTFEDLIDINDLTELFNIKKTTPIFDFTPIVKNGGVYKYLIGRGIPEELHTNIYQAKFSKGDSGFEHIIILLNKRGDKVLGLQVRNLKSGKRRFFVIYNWESLNKWLRGEDFEFDINTTLLYNKLSYFFNILNVDFEKTVTIFEGYLDSMFYPNSIGMIGVNTDDKFLNSNLDLQYFFDNDSAGFNKSVEKLILGNKVFLWNKLFENIVSKKNSIDPYQLLNRIAKVKDLNKLAELIQNPYTKLNLKTFFSSDVYDLKYIPKVVNKKQINEKDYDKAFKNI